MNGVDKLGRKVTVSKVAPRPTPIGDVVDWTEAELRGLLVSILKAGGVKPSKGARVMRTNRRQYFKDASITRSVELKSAS
jgi:hypothetical protein